MRLLGWAVPLLLVANAGVVVARSAPEPVRETQRPATVAAAPRPVTRPAPPKPAPKPVPRGRVVRYAVEVDPATGEDPAAFAAAVEATLADPRGWRRTFVRVESGPVAFRVVLASPATTDRLCRPLDTGGVLSCFMRGRAVVNVHRWRTGAAAYGADLASYRAYLVNHEVGHALGFGHRRCPGPGRLAPVMMQQTKGVGRCRPNPWPAVA
jgi:hypothetical protein